jgi:subtilisin family serine protease
VGGFFVTFRTRSAGLAVVVFICAVVSAAPAAAAPVRDASRVGDYIVQFKDSVKSVGQQVDQLEQNDGFSSSYRYSHALKGFAATLDAGQVRSLRSNPSVAYVVPDLPVHATDVVAPGEAVPTGVRRFEAATATTSHGASTVNVAVIDTGIDLTHPELNAFNGKNCMGAGTANDDNGHGSHVAGTIAAGNVTRAGATENLIGVAPGTKLYAVKVLDSSGSGSDSTVTCGIDWVAANAGVLGIKVANMSLGGSRLSVPPCGGSDMEHNAICNATASPGPGVTFVVAAGNSSHAFDSASAPDVPAAYPEVLSVTALSDSDGTFGGTGGAPTCRTGETDDRPATFSSWAGTAGGQAHTIAAPGVCIRSSWMAGTYNTISGTSMATPHMVGAVALCLGEGGAAGPCTGLTPAQIVQKMRTDAEAHTTTVPAYGFVGDPAHSPVAGRYFGYLYWVPPSGPPLPSITFTSTAISVPAGGSAGGTISLATAAPPGGVTVTLSSSSPTGSFTPASIPIAEGARTGSFSYTDTKAGSPTLGASAPGYSSGSQGATVTVGPTTALTIAPASTTLGGGGSQLFTVSGKDAYGNPGAAVSGTAWSTTAPGGLSATIGTSTTFTASAPGNGTITASRSGATDGTATITVVAQPIANGDFEAATPFSGWTVGGGKPTPSISTLKVHSLTRSALAGWTGASGEPLGDSWIQQQLTVPSAGGTLNMWVWQFTTDSVRYDWQTCELRNTGGTRLTTFFKQAGNARAWQKRSYSLTTWKGQAVVLWCNVHEDGYGDETYMYLDDVSVN